MSRFGERGIPQRKTRQPVRWAIALVDPKTLTSQYNRCLTLFFVCEKISYPALFSEFAACCAALELALWAASLALRLTALNAHARGIRARWAPSLVSGHLPREHQIMIVLTNGLPSEIDHGPTDFPSVLTMKFDLRISRI